MFRAFKKMSNTEKNDPCHFAKRIGLFFGQFTAFYKYFLPKPQAVLGMHLSALNSGIIPGKNLPN